MSKLRQKNAYVNIQDFKYFFGKTIYILPPGNGAGTAIGLAKLETMASVKITKLKTKTILAGFQLLQS